MQWLPYVLAAVVIAFAALQLRILSASKRAQGRAAPDLGDVLTPEQRRATKLLLYFFSKNCGPCRVMGPYVDQLAQRYDNVVKIDVMQAPDLVRRFGVMATPTTVLVDNGIVAKVVLGAKTLAQLEALLQ